MEAQIAILAVGDVFAGIGQEMLKKYLPSLKRKLRPDLVLVNGENAADGIGIIPRQAHEFFSLGVDVISGGNHSLARREAFPLLRQEPHLLRPANLRGDDFPGQGWVIARTKTGQRLTIVNLLGSTFMPDAQVDCPFATLEALLQGPLRRENHICVDFHAETTSEKQALAWHFTGRVSACLGTHTHVATADEKILPGGTAYISDIGMTGPYNSVIGMEPKTAIDRFLKRNAPKFKPAQGEGMLNAVLVLLGANSGRAEEISRITIGPSKL